jgi:ABC-type glycerol-3-phosphate transport system substrate-binding protein
MRSRVTTPLLVAATALLTAVVCGAASGAAPSHDSTHLSSKSGGVDGVSIDSPVTISVWHVYAGSNGTAFQTLIDLFHKRYPKITVNSQFVGGYGALHQKLVSAVQANATPNVAIAYENDVAAYQASKQVLNLTPYATSKRYGETKASLRTINPIELKRNTYLMFGGKHYSWPFQLSESLLYYNKDMLRSIGISTPPKTWGQFMSDCAVIKSRLHKKCFSMVTDASTVDGIAYSFGAPSGMLSANGTKTAFRLPAWQKSLQLYQDLVTNGYGAVSSGAEQLASGDMSDFASQQAAFIIRTSLNINYLEQAIGNRFQWGVTIPPQESAKRKPVTVLYGADLTAFKNSSPQQNLASWLLMKFLASTPAQVAWAANTGNLPVRTDALSSKGYRKIVNTDPRIKAALSTLPYARFEGVLNTKGLVAVVPTALRTVVESVQSALMTGAISADAARSQLISQGDPIMATG